MASPFIFNRPLDSRRDAQLCLPRANETMEVGHNLSVNRWMALIGQAGMGKTTFVWNLVQRCASERGTRPLVIPMTLIESKTPHDPVVGFLKEMGISARICGLNRRPMVNAEMRFFRHDRANEWWKREALAV